MEWNTTWDNPLTEYLAPYHELMGDKRTSKTFDEIIKGIIGAGSVVCQRIAAHSPLLSQGGRGAQRVIRLASGESTKRSELDAEHLTTQLRTAAAEYLFPSWASSQHYRFPARVDPSQSVMSGCQILPLDKLPTLMVFCTT